eukprot:Clim_evm94s147 gene=Clim_evmTU94s147
MRNWVQKYFTHLEKQEETFELEQMLIAVDIKDTHDGFARAYPKSVSVASSAKGRKLRRGKDSKAVLRQFLLYWVPTIVVLTLFIWISYYLSVAQAIDKVEIDLVGDIHTLDAAVDRAVNVYASAMSFLSQSQKVRTFVQEYNNGEDTTESKESAQLLFSSFMENYNDLFKLRLIDMSGDEIIRVDMDRDSGVAIVYDDDQLENKADTQYHEPSISLNSTEVYMSRLDLHTEEGVIEEPYMFTFRMSHILCDEVTRQPIVYLIMNVNAEKLLVNEFQKSQMLYDGEGYFLKYAFSTTPVPQLAGFLFPDDDRNTMQELHPSLYKTISNAEPEATQKSRSSVVGWLKADLPARFTSNWYDMTIVSPDMEALTITYVEGSDDLGTADTIFLVCLILWIVMFVTSLLICLNLAVSQVHRRRLRKAFAEDIKRNMASKMRFLATMSHELLTPLNAIIGIAPSLSKAPNLTEEQEENIDLMTQSAYVLNDIIRDVLDVTKIDAGKVELCREHCSIGDIATNTMNMITRAVGKDVRLYTIIGPNVPSTVYIDPFRLRQIIMNMLSNAAKFTKHGFIAVHIDVLGDGEDMHSTNEKSAFDLHHISNETLSSSAKEDCDLDLAKVDKIAIDIGPKDDSSETASLGSEDVPGGQRLRLRITDTGIGMTAAQLQQIFEPFSQADGSTTRKYGGTGLGLHISMKLLKLMGGFMTVESRSHCGSQFTITVPLEEQSTDTLQEPISSIPSFRDSSTPSSSDSQVSFDNAVVVYFKCNEQEKEVLNITSQRVFCGFKPIACDDIASVEQAMGNLPYEMVKLVYLGTASHLCPEASRRLQAITEAKDIRIVRFVDQRLASIFPSGNSTTTGTSGTGNSSSVDGDYGEEAVLPSVNLPKVVTIWDVIGATRSAMQLPNIRTHSSVEEADETIRYAMLKNARILVAEDHKINQRVILKLLKPYVKELVIVENGALAIDALKQNPFDLVILDYHMPVMNGFDAARQICTDMGDYRPYLIGLSACVGSEDAAAGLANGMDHYAVKPIKSEMLLGLLEKTLEERPAKRVPVPLPNIEADPNLNNKSLLRKDMWSKGDDG